MRGPIPSTGYVNGSKAWQLVEFKADQKSAWVTCRLDFYKNPHFMKQFPFAHTITMTYRVSDGALEVHTRLDNLSTEPMPVVIGYHPIFELPDGNRDDWTVSLDAKTHWIEIPQRLPTGETQPIENFFGADRTAIQLKNYGLIDDVFTDLVRDANGRATMKLDVQRQGTARDPRAEVQDRAAVVDAARRGGRRPGPAAVRAAAGGGRAGGSGGARAGTGTVRAVPGRSRAGREGLRLRRCSAAAAGAPARRRQPNRGFIAFEPMVAITNALNLAQKGIYKDLQSIPPGGSWEESFWVRTKGYRRPARLAENASLAFRDVRPDRRAGHVPVLRRRRRDPRRVLEHRPGLARPVEPEGAGCPGWL